MQKQKMNLANMQGRLTRSEMKNIKGGEDELPGGTCPGLLNCPGGTEIGEKCPDVGSSTNCTCRVSGGDRYCMP